MKFKKDFNCRECILKCEIYKAILEIGGDPATLKPMQVALKKNENICKQGSQVTHATYIVSGTAKLYIEGLNSHNIILYILRPHNYVGLLSFFETPRYHYSVKPLEDATVCMVELGVIKRLYIENHNFLISLNRAFGKSVALIMQKIITLNQKNIRGRVADSLLYLSEMYNSMSFDMILTRRELGELSAISEENTVRLLTEFKNEKIIKVVGRHIEILDKPLLKRISEFG
jgi:CRP/FNR family transcriptional regulator